MIITADGKKRRELQEDLMPVRIVDSFGVEDAEILMQPKAASISFQTTGMACLKEAGSFLLLDFGKELCGGIRMVIRASQGTARWRLTFGESLTEACSCLKEKNATNDHSPRNFEIITSSMSDVRHGQTGFRFVRLELLEGQPVLLQSVFAVSTLPLFEVEGEIETNDALLNDIIKTAAYTLKLNFQNGYIWDGIKRDRLVWCGDLHPEIITSLYLFGDNDNIKNSLTFLRNSAGPEEWINTIPSYSAWWVINLCDYCSMTGNREFFLENRDYARKVLEHFDSCIREDGELCLGDGGMSYFLDWSTCGQPDAVAGVASLLRWMAQKFLIAEENLACRNIIEKLSSVVETETVLKPVRAFQILAGRQVSGADADMLQQGGAKGFSTFMAYYILTAMAESGGKYMLDIIKAYYGGMLSRGATSFWEDFDIDWLENSGRIDAFPEEGQKDIHGDFGKYCYTQFRHSLCHGWSSGVLSFIIEYILGIHISDGGETVTVEPHLSGLTDIEAKLPLKSGILTVSVHGSDVHISAPEGTKVEAKSEKKDCK